MPSVCLVATLHLGCNYFSESIYCLPSDILWYILHIKVLDTKLSSFFHLVHYFTKTVYKRMDNTYSIYTTRKWICCCDFRPCFSEYSDQPLVNLQASQKSIWNKIKSKQNKAKQPSTPQILQVTATLQTVICLCICHIHKSIRHSKQLIVWRHSLPYHSSPPCPKIPCVVEKVQKYHLDFKGVKLRQIWSKWLDWGHTEICGWTLFSHSLPVHGLLFHFLFWWCFLLACMPKLTRKKLGAIRSSLVCFFRKHLTGRVSCSSFHTASVVSLLFDSSWQRQQCTLLVSAQV